MTNNNRPRTERPRPDKTMCPRVLSSRRNPVSPTRRTPPNTNPNQSNQGIRGSASKNAGVALRREHRQLAEEFAVDRRRRGVGILPPQHPVHLGDRAAAVVAGAAALVLFLLPPFGTLHGGRVLAQQNTILPLLLHRHRHRLAVHRRQRGRFVGDVGLGRGELFPRHHDRESQQRPVHQRDGGHKRRQRRVVLLAVPAGITRFGEQRSCRRDEHDARMIKHRRAATRSRRYPTTLVTAARSCAPGGPSSGTP